MMRGIKEEKGSKENFKKIGENEVFIKKET